MCRVQETVQRCGHAEAKCLRSETDVRRSQQATVYRNAHLSDTLRFRFEYLAFFVNASYLFERVTLLTGILVSNFSSVASMRYFS